jgi:hypothetical protein
MSITWTYTITGRYVEPSQAIARIRVEFQGDDGNGGTGRGMRDYTMFGNDNAAATAVEQQIQADCLAYANAANLVTQMASINNTGSSTVSNPMAPSLIWATPVDQYLSSLKVQAKTAALSYMKNNPACSEADVLAQLTDPGVNAVGQVLIPIYISNAHQIGAIATADWASFLAFVVATPIETLMGM